MNKLPGRELVWVDEHLIACATCRENVSASPTTAYTAKEFEQALLQPSDHLEYDDLEAFVDGRLRGKARADVARHIETCHECDIELRELQGFVGSRPPAAAPVSGGGWLSRFGSFFARPVPVLASVAALISISAAIWLLKPNEDADVNSITPNVATTETEPEPAPIIEAPANWAVENPPVELAVSINDGGEAVGISRDGELSGYVSVGSNYRYLIKNALAGGKLVLPDLRELNAQAGVLMGDPSSLTGTFRVHSPVGKVVSNDTPTFAWQTVPGAESYLVEVFDQDFNKVASSGEIKSTLWKHKLPRGRTYTWQVTAQSDEKVYKAPQRPQPEARFRILDGRAANDLSSLRRSHPRSHLLLGTAYANAGLIDEAIREFEMLSRQNPRSELPKQWLRQLRRAR